MRMKAGVPFLVVCFIAFVVTGCGGGGGAGSSSHTYIVTPSATSGEGALAKGIYLTIVSPVAFPQSVLDKAKKSVTFVEQATGPEVCSQSKKIQGVKGKYADLNGETVTVKVNGSNPLTSLVCSGLKKQAGFDPTNAGTH
jgi:hypothetical protein